MSHDRYFLNTVCTNIVDVDYGKIKIYPGNYDFWYESNQLIQKQMKESNKKKEEKINVFIFLLAIGKLLQDLVHHKDQNKQHLERRH